MQLEFIREFIVLSHRMSYTKAALELHVSQSSLSKHIHQMEAELGFPLVTRASNRFSLTPSGQHFLQRISPLADEFSKSVNECRQINERYSNYIVIREPTFSDEASDIFYNLIGKFQTETGYSIRLSSVRHKTPIEQILQNDIDGHLVYEYGEREKILGFYQSINLSAYFLGSEQLLARMNKSHRLAEKSMLEPSDFKGVPLATINGSFDPMRMPIKALCREAGFEPNFFTILAESLSEYYLSMNISDAVQIVPLASANDSKLLASSEKIWVPINPEIRISSLLLVTNNDGVALNELRAFFTRHQS